jgi:imidazolonepropionase-like amidohydrolase
MKAIAVAIAMGFLGAVSSYAAEAQGRSSNHDLYIQDVTLISSERAVPLAHANVLIKGGRIARVETLPITNAARRLDGHGRFLIPGLIDSHVHVGQPVGLDHEAIAAHPELLTAYRAQVPRAFLAFGFTTLVDLNFQAQTRAWFDAAPIHPRLYSCGPGVSIAGGYPRVNYRVPKDPRTDDIPNLVYEPAQTEHWPAVLDPRDYSPLRAVERAAATGAICLKVFVESGFNGVFHWPIPRPETLTALHAAAAARHLPMVVHANGVDAWQAALDAHAEVIAHGLWHWPGTRDEIALTPAARAVIARAAHDGVFVQPTLQVVYGERTVFDASIIDDPRFALAMPRELVAYLHSNEAAASWRGTRDSYSKMIANADSLINVAGERASASLRLMQESGVHLLFGSDTPSGEGFGNPPGLNGQLELQRWADAGVPLPRILRAATLDNAIAFGLEKELGTIAIGKRADLLLLAANPLTDVKAFDSIETVIVNGEPVQRNRLLAR